MLCCLQASAQLPAAHKAHRGQRGSLVNGWGNGDLAQKGDLIAGFDIAAELEALLAGGDPEGDGADVATRSPLQDVNKWSVGGQGMEVVDIDDEDGNHELEQYSQEIKHGLQEHLAALEDSGWAD